MSFACFFGLIELGLTFYILRFNYITFLLNKSINKEKNLAKKQEEKKA
jgi:hypothetical protein